MPPPKQLDEPRWRPRLATPTLHLVTVATLSACARLDYESVKRKQQPRVDEWLDLETFRSGRVSDAADGRASAGSGPIDSGLGDAASAAGGAGGLDSDGGADSGGPGPGGVGPCVLTGSETMISDFDLGPGSGIAVSGTGAPTLGWTSDIGYPSPGCLDFENPPGGDAALTSTPQGSFTGRVFSTNVYVASGSDVALALYAESGSVPGSSARGATVVPPVGQWSCVSLDFDAPESSAGGFDAGALALMRLSIAGGDGVRVYVDRVAY